MKKLIKIIIIDSATFYIYKDDISYFVVRNKNVVRSFNNEPKKGDLEEYV